jgi:hypothetical protein
MILIWPTIEGKEREDMACLNLRMSLYKLHGNGRLYSEVFSVNQVSLISLKYIAKSLHQEGDG